MRTKTLLLTAALSAAGIATSMAQVFSVNAVGYVNTPIVKGFNLISNPLMATSNAIKDLFKDVPDGTFVYKFVNGQFAATQMDEFGGRTFDPPAVAALTVMPGEGVFVQPPGAATITFVGEVPQGALANPLVHGLQIVSSQVPQAGTVDDLKMPTDPGDFLYQWNSATQSYAAFTQDEFGGGWSPSVPSLKVGEAVFLQRVNGVGSWTRTFSVNQ